MDSKTHTPGQRARGGRSSRRLVAAISLVSGIGVAVPALTVETAQAQAVTLQGVGSLLAPAYCEDDSCFRGGNFDILTSPDGQYLYNQTFSYLQRIDIASFTVEGRIDLEGAPERTVLSKDRQSAYIVTVSANRLLVETLNLTNGTVSTPAVELNPGGLPWRGVGAAAVGDVPGVGRMMYVYSPGNSFFAEEPYLFAANLDTGAATVTNLRTTIGLARGASGYTLGVSADGTQLYLSANGAGIRVFDAATLVSSGYVIDNGVGQGGGDLMEVHDDAPGNPLGLIYSVDTGSALLRVINASTGVVVRSSQLTGRPQGLYVRPNGDVVVSYQQPKVSYIDAATNNLVTTALVDEGVEMEFDTNTFGIVVNESAEYGLCIYTTNNGGDTLSAVSVDGGDCGPFTSRFGALPASIPVNGQGSMSIEPPSSSSREAPWVGIAVFVDGVLARVIAPDFGTSIELAWADLQTGLEVVVRAYNQAHLDIANLLSVDDVTFETQYLHQRTTRLEYIPLKADEVSAGHFHSCANDSGRVYCWGRNSDGQLGDGSTTDRTTAVEVEAAGGFTNTDVTHLDAGRSHTCAIENGSVYCWGYGSSGRLGDGDTTTRLVPTKVPNVEGVFTNANVTAVAAGEDHTCAIASSSVYCWGNGGDGRLGDGFTTTRLVPTKVANVDGVFTNANVTAVAAEKDHTCAIASGSVFCWGWNYSGALGDGTTTNSNVPVKVANVDGGFTNTGATAIAVGNNLSCAIVNGIVFCWGNSADGKLGIDSSIDQRTPVRVLDRNGFVNTGVSHLTTGYIHACAVKASEMYCWGSGGDGEIGDGARSNRRVATKVAAVTGGFGNSDVSSISGGYDHTCAIDNGDVYCWGLPFQGRLGNGYTSGTFNTPSAVCCTPPEVVFELSVQIVGDGSVTSDPVGIDCVGDCTEEFPADSEVALTAEPGPGQRFVGWSGSCSGSSVCVVTMSAARPVTATFRPAPTLPTTSTGPAPMLPATGTSPWLAAVALILLGAGFALRRSTTGT